MTFLRHSRKRLLAALWFSMVVTSTSSVSAADRPATRELANFFANVVFGSEYETLTEDRQVVNKWTSPIRVSVSSMTGQLVKRNDGTFELKMANQRPSMDAVTAIKKYLNTLVKYSGVKTEDSKKVGKPANFFIKLVPTLAMHAPFLEPSTDPETLRMLARSGVCYLVFFAPGGAIQSATIVVNNELPRDRMDACILEEMTQAFGLKNDSDIVQPSIFNQHNISTTLYRTDILLLAALYDEKISAGMPINTAMPVATGIIDHLNRVMAVQ